MIEQEDLVLYRKDYFAKKTHKEKNREWYAKVKDDPDFKKRKAENSARYRSDHKYHEIESKKRILRRLKNRAKSKLIPFNLELCDIEIPAHCPILGIPIFCHSGRSREDSVSVDRIIPELGYVKGNIVIVSNRANRIKTDSTLSELDKIVQFYKQLNSSTPNWQSYVQVHTGQTKVCPITHSKGLESQGWRGTCSPGLPGATLSSQNV